MMDVFQKPYLDTSTNISYCKHFKSISVESFNGDHKIIFFLCAANCRCKQLFGNRHCGLFISFANCRLEQIFCRLLVWIFFSKGWGLSVKLGKHSAIWGKLGTALQTYTMNPLYQVSPKPHFYKSQHLNDDFSALLEQ